MKKTICLFLCIVLILSLSTPVLAGTTRYECETPTTNNTNNTRATADTIYDDDTMYGRISYSDDVDYYKVTFSSAGKANFWLGDIPSGVDYDLCLCNSYGGVLKASTSTSSQELISAYQVSANTLYYLKVFSCRGSSNKYYRIRAKNYPTGSSGTTIPDDPYEPNDNMTQALNVSSNGTITSATLNDAQDVDYYMFTIDNESKISISLSNIPSSCDYDLTLCNASKTYNVSSTFGGNTNEAITYQNAPAGIYYVIVSSYSGFSANCYKLSITTTTNAMLSAKTIFNDSSAYGRISSSGEADYYKVKFATAGYANFWLGNIPSGKDYDLYLYSDSEEILDSSTSTLSQEQISNFLVSANTWYYLKVIGYKGAYDKNSDYCIRAKNYPGKLVVAIAEDEVGYIGKPNNKVDLDVKGIPSGYGSGDYTKYARDLYNLGYYDAGPNDNNSKQNQPWCDVFVDWCFYRAFDTDGNKIQYQHKNLDDGENVYGAGCSESMEYYDKNGAFHWAESKYNNLKSQTTALNRSNNSSLNVPQKYNPQIGDQIFIDNGSGNMVDVYGGFDLKTTTNSGHTGIVVKVETIIDKTTDTPKTLVTTIEGNTLGNKVAYVTYTLPDNARVIGFGHPDFD